MAVEARRYTIDEWFDSPANTPRMELVDGIPVERMTASGDHGEVVKVLERWVDRAEFAGLGRRYSGPTGAILDAAGARLNVREPDVFFYRRVRPIGRRTKGIEGVPDLAIEVLSPDNKRDDLPGGAVWQSYERFGVPAYWVVDIEARTVTQYEHRDGAFVLVGRAATGDVLSSSLFPGITLPVADLFQALDADSDVS